MTQLFYCIAFGITYSLIGGWVISSIKEYRNLNYFGMCLHIASWPVVLFYKILIEE